MKNSLTEKLKSGIDYVKSNTGKALTIGCLGLASVLYSNDANAQNYDVKGLVTGSEYKTVQPENYKGTALERLKMGGINLYVRDVDPGKYDDDLSFGFLRMDSTATPVNMATGKIKNFFSKEGQFYLRPATDEKGKAINKLVVCEPCRDYEENSFGNSDKPVETGRSNVLVPEHNFFDINNNEWLVYKSEKFEGYKDKLPFVISRRDLTNSFKDPTTGQRVFVGPFYQPVIGDKNVLVNAETGETTYLDAISAESDSLLSSMMTPQASKESKKISGDFILGLNANSKFNYFEGQAGLRVGPVAFGINAGKSTSEEITETQTEPSELTGNYGYGKVVSKNTLSVGPFAEVHLLPNKRIDPFLTAGMNFRSNDLTITEGIKNSEGNWKPGSPGINATNEDEKSYRLGAGVEIGKLRFSGSYDTLEGMVGNISISLPIWGGNK